MTAKRWNAFRRQLWKYVLLVGSCPKHQLSPPWVLLNVKDWPVFIYSTQEHTHSRLLGSSKAGCARVIAFMFKWLAWGLMEHQIRCWCIQARECAGSFLIWFHGLWRLLSLMNCHLDRSFKYWFGHKRLIRIWMLWSGRMSCDENQNRD